MDARTDFERMVAQGLEDVISAPPLPDDYVDEVRERAARTRRRPHWLAKVTEPPLRAMTGVVVGSPTARVAALTATTILLAVMLAVSGFAGARLLATSDAIVVAADGSGDYSTIGAAVAAAGDGQRILVKPGTYPESVIVDRSVEIVGEGDRSQIIVEPGAAARPSAEDQAPFGLMLDNTDATVRNLTVRSHGPSTSIIVVGGAPVLEGVTAQAATEIDADPDSRSLVIRSGSEAFVSSSVMLGDIDISGQAAPRLVGNDLQGFVDLDDAGHVVFTDNTAAAVRLDWPSTATIENNTFALPAASRGAAIMVDQHRDGGATDEVTVRGNRVTGPYDRGIDLTNGLGPRVIATENEVNGTDVAVVVRGLGPIVVSDNDLRHNGSAVRADQDAVVTLSGNRIEDNDVGLTVRGEARPLLLDNVFCRNGTDLDAPQGSRVTLRGNDVCEVAIKE